MCESIQQNDQIRSEQILYYDITANEFVDRPLKQRTISADNVRDMNKNRRKHEQN